MYLFAKRGRRAQATQDQDRLRFLAGSIVFSLSLTSISWLGYLLLENRFTGRLKLFATLPLAPSSYIFGFLGFAFMQAALGTTGLLLIGRFLGVNCSQHPDACSGNHLDGALLVWLRRGHCGARAQLYRRLAADRRTWSGTRLLAPVYYTPETMPHSLRVLSELLPTAFAASAVRTALAGGHHIGTEVLALGLIAVITLALGFRLTKWRED